MSVRFLKAVSEPVTPQSWLIAVYVCLRLRLRLEVRLVNCLLVFFLRHNSTLVFAHWYPSVRPYQDSYGVLLTPYSIAIWNRNQFVILFVVMALSAFLGTFLHGVIVVSFFPP